MIYYIVEIKDNGDETVFSSHDNAEMAAKMVELYRGQSVNHDVAYRIDTVPGNEEVRERNAAIPADPHKLPSKNYGMDLPAPIITPDFTQEQREAVLKGLKNDRPMVLPSEPPVYGQWFTVKELFTERAEGDYIASPCAECGALVIDTGFHDYTAKHADWHNKLLP